jgi:hypothetical protein
VPTRWRGAQHPPQRHDHVAGFDQARRRPGDSGVDSM